MAENGGQLVVLNHFLRQDSDGLLYCWRPDASNPYAFKCAPELIEFIAQVAENPCSLAGLQDRLVEKFRGEPRQVRIFCKRLLKAAVLISPEALDLGYELLRGRDPLRLDGFLANVHTIEYARAAVRLGLKFESKAPDVINITGNGLQHTIKKAGFKTLEDEHAAYLSTQKDRCTAIWRDMGLPVPREARLSADKLMDAPRLVGYPLVVKPLDLWGARGVFTNICSEEELRNVVSYCLEDDLLKSRDFIVQEFVAGIDHRILMVGDQVAAVCQRRLPSIVGDGHRTIRELVASEEFRVGGKLSFEHPSVKRTLRQLGLNENSVIPARERVVLSHTAHIQAGAFIVIVTDTIHPSYCEAALRAKEAIGLKVAGLDLVTPDATRPIEEVGGVFLEINDSPGIAVFIWPDEGKPCWMADEMLRYMFELDGA